MIKKKTALLLIPTLAFFICFSIYQIFAETGNVEWTIFFENTFYLLGIGFLTKEAIYGDEFRALFGLFDACLITTFLFQFLYIGKSVDFHKYRLVLNDSYYFFPFVVLVIFITFMLFKLRFKRK